MLYINTCIVPTTEVSRGANEPREGHTHNYLHYVHVPSAAFVVDDIICALNLSAGR